jgi:MFS transporter, PAT family, beta-lactamase induction signal transducer AmpG
VHAPAWLKLIWVGLFYFASGFPFGLITELLPVYFRVHGVSLTDIGIYSLVGLPWTLKFLWSPLLDRFGTRKQWIVACQLLMGALLLLVMALDPEGAMQPLFVVLLVLATLSATQDIAVDAYTIELLERRELGPANGMRVTAYRIALIASGGWLVGLAAPLGWTPVFLLGAGLFGALALLTLRIPTTARQRTHAPLLEPLRELLTRRNVAVILLFALLFKLGDQTMQLMSRTFWVDRGMTLAEIGLVLTTGGMIAAIVGAWIGGLFTARFGIFHAVWVLGAVQALSNLGYWLAASLPTSRPLIYGAGMVELLTQGMGTAAFLTYLMSVCDKRYAATQYAILSALYALPRFAIGGYSGRLTESMGYANYFLLTFVLALPAFALVPYIRGTVEEER